MSKCHPGLETLPERVCGDHRGAVRVPASAGQTDPQEAVVDPGKLVPLRRNFCGPREGFPSPPWVVSPSSWTTVFPFPQRSFQSNSDLVSAVCKVKYSPLFPRARVLTLSSTHLTVPPASHQGLLPPCLTKFHC